MSETRNSSWKHWLLLFIGLWLLFSPYIGIPRQTKEVLFVLSGLIAVWLSYVLARPVCDHGTVRQPLHDAETTHTS